LKKSTNKQHINIYVNINTLILTYYNNQMSKKQEYEKVDVEDFDSIDEIFDKPSDSYSISKKCFIGCVTVATILFVLLFGIFITFIIWGGQVKFEFISNPGSSVQPTKSSNTKLEISGLFMKTFTVGNHILTNKDYLFAENIIVEIWGAGGSGYIGSSYSTRAGGGSGSYIKALIKTNQQNFSIHVGKGSSINDENCSYDRGNSLKASCVNGDKSFINSNTIYLSAGGGGGANTLGYPGLGGQILTVSGVEDVLAINGRNGNDYKSNYYIDIRGGDAPNGGIGGYCTNVLYHNFNGTYPGGGGGCLQHVGSGYGADGMIIVYY
jgi:hypothetical protein